MFTDAFCRMDPLIDSISASDNWTASADRMLSSAPSFPSDVMVADEVGRSSFMMVLLATGLIEILSLVLNRLILFQTILPFSAFQPGFY